MPEATESVLITGAGRGLGKALALEFLSKGWRVVATDISEPEFDDPTAGALFESHPQTGKNLLLLKMDVTSDESVADVYRFLAEQEITLSLIINNAGIDRYMLLSAAPVKEFRQIFEVNVFGAYRVNQVFIPLLKRPGGRIIHIGSESLSLCMPFMAYPLSKKLLEGYAKGLRQELRFHGIDVVVIRPGAIDTELLKTVSALTRSVGKEEPGDPLQQAFANFALQAGKEIGKVISPAAAASFIYRVACIPRPRAVYRINNMLQLRIAALLPYGLIEKIVHKRLSKKLHDNE